VEGWYGYIYGDVGEIMDEWYVYIYGEYVGNVHARNEREAMAAAFDRFTIDAEDEISVSKAAQ